MKTKERGITLIALIITIIVIIVLVTVTITVTLGENGIIKKSKQAKELNRIKEIQETILMEYSTERAESEKKNEKFKEANLANRINQTKR